MLILRLKLYVDESELILISNVCEHILYTIGLTEFRGNVFLTLCTSVVLENCSPFCLRSQLAADQAREGAADLQVELLRSRR